MVSCMPTMRTVPLDQTRYRSGFPGSLGRKRRVLGRSTSTILVVSSTISGYGESKLNQMLWRKLWLTSNSSPHRWCRRDFGGCPRTTGHGQGRQVPRHFKAHTFLATNEDRMETTTSCFMTKQRIGHSFGTRTTFDAQQDQECPRQAVDRNPLQGLAVNGKKPGRLASAWLDRLAVVGL